MTSPRERLTPRRALAVSLFVTAVMLTIVAARRDLAGRQPGQVRGNQDVWRRITWLPGPSIAYLLFGRRPRATDPDDSTSDG